MRSRHADGDQAESPEARVATWRGTRSLSPPLSEPLAVKPRANNQDRGAEADAPVRSERRGCYQAGGQGETQVRARRRATKHLRWGNRSRFLVETVPDSLRKPFPTPCSALPLLPLNRSRCSHSLPGASLQATGFFAALPCLVPSDTSTPGRAEPGSSRAGGSLRHPRRRAWDAVPQEGAPAAVGSGRRPPGNAKPDAPSPSPNKTPREPRCRFRGWGAGMRASPSFSTRQTSPTQKSPSKTSPQRGLLPHQHPRCSRSPGHLQLLQPSSGSGLSGGQNHQFHLFSPVLPPAVTPFPGRKGENSTTRLSRDAKDYQSNGPLGPPVSSVSHSKISPIFFIYIYEYINIYIYI